MSITESIRNAIATSGMSANELAKKTGITQSMLTRFINGLDIRLATADKLAAYFSLELRHAEPKPVKKAKR